MKRPETREEVEHFNDWFAREHDIDDYYARSGFVIRAIERSRLAAIEDMLDAKPGQRILEIGCGGGHILQRFPQARLTGVDVSGEMLAKAERNLRGYDVELLKGEVGDLGLVDQGFDGIVCSEVLEHVVEPERILEQIRRLARPGARIVITFPNDPLIHRLKNALRRSGATRLPPFRHIAWGGDDYHFHVWHPQEMRALLERYFHVERAAFVPLRLIPIRCCFLCSPSP